MGNQPPRGKMPTGVPGTLTSSKTTAKSNKHLKKTQ